MQMTVADDTGNRRHAPFTDRPTAWATLATTSGETPSISHPAGTLPGEHSACNFMLAAGRGDGVSDWQWHSTQGAAPHREVLRGAEYALSFHVCFQGRVECFTVTQPGVPGACYASGCSAMGRGAMLIVLVIRSLMKTPSVIPRCRCSTQLPVQCMPVVTWELTPSNSLDSINTQEPQQQSLCSSPPRNEPTTLPTMPSVLLRWASQDHLKSSTQISGQSWLNAFRNAKKGHVLDMSALNIN